MKRESTQSIAVSPEEKLLIDVLAKGYRLKPATFARHMFYRGLYAFLQDGKMFAPMMEQDILEAVERLISEDETLSSIKNKEGNNKSGNWAPPERSMLEISEPLMSVGTTHKLSNREIKEVKKDLKGVRKDAHKRENRRRLKRDP